MHSVPLWSNCCMFASEVPNIFYAPWDVIQHLHYLNNDRSKSSLSQYHWLRKTCAWFCNRNMTSDRETIRAEGLRAYTLNSLFFQFSLTTGLPFTTPSRMLHCGQHETRSQPQKQQSISKASHTFRRHSIPCYRSSFKEQKATTQTSQPRCHLPLFVVGIETPELDSFAPWPNRLTAWNLEISHVWRQVALS